MSTALELASYCDDWPGKVHAEVAAELRRLAEEVETLRSERTAWRVTAENAEAAVRQARIDALEEAKQAVDIEGFREPKSEYETGYNMACDVCIAVVESLKGKAP